MSRFTIKFDGGWLTLTVYGYERATASDETDANWLRCRLDFKLNALTGSIPLSALTTDIASFRDDIQTCLSSLYGSATFHNTEDVCDITIQFGKTGNARIAGRIHNDIHTSYTINFNSTSDQTHISHCLDQLTVIMGKFPVARFNTTD